MKTITAQSPTRVDLAGGTLDLWPLYLFHENAVTVNLAIDVYTRAHLTPRKDNKIILMSRDTDQILEYKNLNDLCSDNTDSLKLLKVHAMHWKPKKGFELVTESESPIGGGISGSSSLNISLCGAFTKWLGIKMKPEELIRLAGNLEAKVINSPTGCQDYFPPYFGGLNFIELTSEGPKRKKAALNLKKFAECFTLVYTGRPHHSGINNWQIYKSHIEGNVETFNKLEKIKNVALEMKKACLKKDFKSFGSVFNKEYDARIELSSVFSSPEIERLKKIALSHGAEAVKICGAGGGGCVFLWSLPQKKRILEEQCAREGFQVLRAKPVEKGLVVKTSSKQ